MGNPANQREEDNDDSEEVRVSGVRLAVVVSPEEAERGSAHRSEKYDHVVVYPPETVDLVGDIREIITVSLLPSNEKGGEDVDDDSIERILDLADGAECGTQAETNASSRAHEDFATYHRMSVARQKLALDFLEDRLIRRAAFAVGADGFSALDLFAQDPDGQRGLERLVRANHLDCRWLNHRILSLLRRAGIPEEANSRMFRRLGSEPRLSAAGLSWLEDLRKRVRRGEAARRYAFREATRPLRAQLGDSILARALEERGYLRRVNALLHWDGDGRRFSLPDAVTPRSLRRALAHMPPPGWHPDPASVGQPGEFQSSILTRITQEIRMDLLGRGDPAAVKLATYIFKLRGISPASPL